MIPITVELCDYCVIQSIHSSEISGSGGAAQGSGGSMQCGTGGRRYVQLGGIDHGPPALAVRGRHLLLHHQVPGQLSVQTTAGDADQKKFCQRRIDF